MSSNTEIAQNKSTFRKLGILVFDAGKKTSKVLNAYSTTIANLIFDTVMDVKLLVVFGKPEFECRQESVLKTHFPKIGQKVSNARVSENAFPMDSNITSVKHWIASLRQEIKTVVQLKDELDSRDESRITTTFDFFILSGV